MKTVKADILMSFSNQEAECRVCRRVTDGMTVTYTAGRVRYKGRDEPGELFASHKRIERTAHVCRWCLSRFVTWLYKREEIWACTCDVDIHDWTPWRDYYEG